MEKKTKKVENKKQVKELSKPFSNKFDPNGSYTGVSNQKSEKPIQDADDL